jgi:hypothetical protein
MFTIIFLSFHCTVLARTPVKFDQSSQLQRFYLLSRGHHEGQWPLLEQKSEYAASMGVSKEAVAGYSELRWDGRHRFYARSGSHQKLQLRHGKMYPKVDVNFDRPGID